MRIGLPSSAPPISGVLPSGWIRAALKSIPRPSVVVATKAFVHRSNTWFTPEQVVASLDNSLKLLGTDYVDLFQLHGVVSGEYQYSLETLGPALLKEKAKGNKIVAAKEERPTGTNVVDLMDALRKSVKSDKPAKVPAAGKAAAGKGGDKSPPSKKAGSGRR